MAELIDRAVGIDLVSVDRIRRAISDTPGFVDRCFTPSERAVCEARHDPAECYAARWAAKEAVIKCLGGGVPGVNLHEIEVRTADDGAPTIALSGATAERALARGVSQVLISLSHTADAATAVALAAGRVE